MGRPSIVATTERLVDCATADSVAQHNQKKTRICFIRTEKYLKRWWMSLERANEVKEKSFSFSRKRADKTQFLV